MAACPSCGTEHAAGARFCSTCGAALWVECPACGAEQHATAAFCQTCGTALRAGASRAPAAGSEERRVVTLLFADMAGSTALGGTLDPEDVRAVQQEFYALAAAEVERFGGVTEKFAGDAVPAVFGIPLAHEDDPERAVRAALAVREGFAPFADRVAQRHGSKLGLRIGVNTGDVVSGREAAARGELMVSGDAVNLAARMQQAALEGEVLVGVRTRIATRAAIGYGPERSVTAKGVNGPVAVAPAVTALETRVERGIPGLRAPLIGRDDELELLGTLARRVARDRQPQLVTLFGAAGVGKSRLIREFADRERPRLLVGRCLPYGDGITWWPLAEIVKGHAGILETDPAPIARVKLAAALMPLGDEELLQALSQVLGLGEDDAEQLHFADTRRALVAAFVRLLGGLGRERFTVVAVEDIHWASPPLLDLLETVVAELADTAVMTVCASRPELLDSRPQWGAGRRNATSISLAPLRPEEADLLITSLLHLDQLEDETRERIRTRAEGNPFYTEEILRMLIDGGAIAERDGAWVATERINGIPLPDSVHGVISARIDLLSAHERQTLRDCAVVGRRFWPGAVGADPAMLAGLAQRELVHELPASSVAGESEWVFKHALTREVAYGVLPRAERCRLHVQVAEWIERVAPGDQESMELVAHHYAQAIESGEVGPEVRAAALDASLAAARLALRRSIAAAASAHLDRALELADTDLDRGRVELAQGEAALWLNFNADGVAHLSSARERFARAGARELEGDALGWLSRGLWYQADQPEALAAAEEAVRLLAHGPDSPALARALARRSQIEMLSQRPEAVPHSEEAVAMARRVGDRFAEANAMVNAATARSFAGDLAGAGEQFVEASQLAVACGAFEEALRSRVNHLWTLEIDSTISELRAAMDRHAAIPPIMTSAYGDYYTLSVDRFLHLPAGEWGSIEPHLRPDWVDRTRSTSTVRMLWLEVGGQVALARGDLATAEVLIAESLEWADRTGEPQRVSPTRALAAQFAALTGRPDDVLAHVRAAVENLRGRLGISSSIQLAQQGGRALLMAVPVEDARPLVDAIVALIGDQVTRRGTASRATLAGLVLLAEGRPDDAAVSLTRARDVELEREAPYHAAVAERDLAGALEAAGDMAGAAAARARAAQVLDPLAVVHPL